MISPRRDGGDNPRPLSTETLLGARMRRRTFGVLDRGETSWTFFLVTYADPGGSWRGHFEFRSAESVTEEEEVRTAALFIEPSEGDVDTRARGLGRPLLQALLESA